MFFIDEIYSATVPPGWKKAPQAEQRDMISRKSHKRNDSGGKRNSLFSLRSTDATIPGHGTGNKRLSQAVSGDSSGSSQRSSVSLADQKNALERSSGSLGKSKRLTRFTRMSGSSQPPMPSYNSAAVAPAASPRPSLDQRSISSKRSTGFMSTRKFDRSFHRPDWLLTRHSREE
jgi:hypothetical protein